MCQVCIINVTFIELSLNIKIDEEKVCKFERLLFVISTLIGILSQISGVKITPLFR